MFAAVILPAIFMRLFGKDTQRVFSEEGAHSR